MRLAVLRVFDKTFVVPRGPVHESFNSLLILAEYVFTRSAVANGILSESLVLSHVLGFAAGTYLITPDLDMADRKAVTPLRFWGPLRALWWPYGRAFKHRRLSHTWLLGPATRLAYLMALAALILALAARLKSPLPGLLFRWVGDHPGLVGAWVFGYFNAQWAHLIVDRVLGKPRGRPRATGSRHARVHPRPRGRA